MDTPRRAPRTLPQRLRAAAPRFHRWFGLAAAVALFIAGLTGAVISWDQELDAWLNPQLFNASSEGPPRPPAELAAAIEAADPRVRVTYFELAAEPGRAQGFSVQPRIDPATQRPFELDHNQVTVDPASGRIVGRRLWGEVSLSREHLLPFLYKLHYSLHIPAGGGIEFGIWLMGLIAIGWVADCFVALWLAFPKAAAWRRSLALRWRAGGHRLVFDLHRSGAVWTWLLVLMLAVTSVSMNLQDEVMRPVLSWFSPLAPSPFASRKPAPPERPIEPAFGVAEAVELGRAEARRRGWTVPAGAAFVSTRHGVWGVGFFLPGRERAGAGLGNPWLYFDSRSGALVGERVPGTGSAGDVFLQAMFPLHSGRIAGTPGRVLTSLMGVAVAVFSATGVLIWLRKRRARAAARQGASPAVNERGMGAAAPAGRVR